MLAQDEVDFASVNLLLVLVEMVEGHVTEEDGQLGLLFIPCLRQIRSSFSSRLTQPYTQPCPGIVGNVSDYLKQSIVNIGFDLLQQTLGSLIDSVICQKP